MTSGPSVPSPAGNACASPFLRVSLHLLRLVSLVLLAGLGTILLMRWSPGYFADQREMDTQYAATGRQALEQQRQAEGSLPHFLRSSLAALAHGDLGVSRQYNVPVGSLLRPRAAVTARLLTAAVAAGWLLSLVFALLLASRRAQPGQAAEALIAAPSALLLAIPAGALATFALVADFGGPLLVLAALVAGRDFKLVYRLLRRTLLAPHYLYARAQGLSRAAILRVHILPSLARELFALLLTSIVVALSLIVPVEVVFDLPGLGQLAWSAALNRDLPVLLAITLVLAACVATAGALAEATRTHSPAGAS